MMKDKRVGGGWGKRDRLLKEKSCKKNTFKTKRKEKILIIWRG